MARKSTTNNKKFKDFSSLVFQVVNFKVYVRIRFLF